MAKNPSFSYKQQNKGVWDHTTSGYLVQSFFSFLVVYSGCGGGCVSRYAHCCMEEEFAWEGMRFGWKWRLTPAFVIRFEARLSRGLP